MFCPNCNAELPDGSAFCGCCGTKLTQPETQTYTAPAAPAYPGYAAYSSYARPRNNMTKKEFLVSDAGMAAKAKGKLALIACLVAVAVIIASIFATLSMPIFDIPAVSFVLDLSGSARDVDELMDMLDDGIDEVEEEFELAEDELSKSEQKDVETWLESAEALSDSFSVLNISSFAKETENLVNEYGDEMEIEDVEGLAEGFIAFNAAMAGVIVLLVGFFVLPILFAVLGGTLKNTALTIIGIVFTAISQIIFCGVLWVALSLVIGVVQAVLCSKVSAAYRDYRMGKLPA